MKKISIQSFSILGVVLMGVSAVTASILPSANRSDVSKFDQPGSLTASTNNCGMISCTPTAIINGCACNVTVLSGTTGLFAGSYSDCTTICDN